MGSNISTFGTFTMARLGIYAATNGLTVTGNNISNINTEGYTRQTLDQSSLYLKGSDRYYSTFSRQTGSGAIVKHVTQIRDPYLDIRYRNENANVGAADAKLAGLNDIASVLDEVGKGDGDGVLEAQINDMLTQLENLVTQGAGQEEYDTLLRSSSSSLCSIFNLYADKLETLRKNEEDFFYQEVETVNGILSSIQELNSQIRKADIHGSDALEQRDERNLLIDELSNYIDIKVQYVDEDLGGFTVEKLLITVAGNDDLTNVNSKDVSADYADRAAANGATLVDGIYVTQLSVRQVPVITADSTLSVTDDSGATTYLSISGDGQFFLNSDGEVVTLEELENPQKYSVYENGTLQYDSGSYVNPENGSGPYVQLDADTTYYAGSDGKVYTYTAKGTLMNVQAVAVETEEGGEAYPLGDSAFSKVKDSEILCKDSDTDTFHLLDRLKAKSIEAGEVYVDSFGYLVTPTEGKDPENAVKLSLDSTSDSDSAYTDYFVDEYGKVYRADADDKDKDGNTLYEVMANSDMTGVVEVGTDGTNSLTLQSLGTDEFLVKEVDETTKETSLSTKPLTDLTATEGNYAVDSAGTLYKLGADGETYYTMDENGNSITTDSDGNPITPSEEVQNALRPLQDGTYYTEDYSTAYGFASDGAALKVMQATYYVPELTTTASPLELQSGWTLLEDSSGQNNNLYAADSVGRLYQVNTDKKLTDTSFTIDSSTTVSSQNYNIDLEPLKDRKDRVQENMTASIVNPYSYSTEADANNALAGLQGSITLENGKTTETSYAVVSDTDTNGDTVYNVVEYTKVTSDVMELYDNTLYGALQSERELLTEAGEFCTDDQLVYDPNSATKRGYPYYQDALDALAQKFAEIINSVNDDVTNTSLENPIVIDGYAFETDGAGSFVVSTEDNCALEELKIQYDENGDPYLTDMQKLHLLPEGTEFTASKNFKDNVSGKNYTAGVTYEALGHNGENTQTVKGGVLISNSGNGNDSTGITASNISVSLNWSTGDVRVVNSWTSDGSTANDNLVHFLAMMTNDDTHDFRPSDIGIDAASNEAYYTGTYQGMLNNIWNVMANDQMVTDTILENYSTSLDGLYVDRDSVSGVDLNDETMSLIQYQKAYQAACRLLTTIDETLDKLINGTAV